MIANLNLPGPDKFHLRADVINQLEAEERANPGSVKLCEHGLPRSLFGRAATCPHCKEVYTQAATGREKINGPEI